MRKPGQALKLAVLKFYAKPTGRPTNIGTLSGFWEKYIRAYISNWGLSARAKAYFSSNATKSYHGDKSSHANG